MFSQKKAIFDNPLKKDVYMLLQASYSDQDAEIKMRQSGYVFDAEYSNIRTRVWTKEGIPYILHRGSIDIVKDFLISDVLLLFNKTQFDPRYYEALRITKSVQMKYRQSANHVGHSLGGNVSELVASPKSWVITYNKGTSPYSIFKPINSRQTDIRTKNDLISLMSKFQNRDVITVQNTTGTGLFGPHEIGNLKSFI